MADTIKGTWETFSRRFTRSHELPRGTTLQALRKKDGRKVRIDLGVRYRKFGVDQGYEPAAGGATVKALLDLVPGLLLTDIVARGYELQLVDPQGTPISGRKEVKAVRAMAPLASEAEKHYAEEREERVAELQQTYARYLASESRANHDPEEIAEALLRAFRDAFGDDILREAVAGARKVKKP